MKKILGILGVIVALGAYPVWKSIDTKVIKQSDEVLTQVIKQSKKADKAVSVVATSVKELVEKSLKVKNSTHTYIKNGIKKTIKVADFSQHSIFSTTLSKDLLVATRELHYENALKGLQKSFSKNKDEFIEVLKKRNAIIMKRDKEFFEANKKQIRAIEQKMITASKNNNLIKEKELLSELRNIANKITFKLTPKGKPIQFLDENQILKRQLADITNPKLNRKSKVFGFTWHHNEKKGVMNLVDEVVHKFNDHAGGYSKWGTL
ncbi:HNH endonuclease [Winogradskyella sp. F6397]|uniref:HNH endonuclease n=1 Tax=Winogradskyella marina TaxID=2785530 RepID=A0ABS0EI25_9FLAO|nr:HNH endonuclease [Winogradskyella marina]MBF8150100.1 HNH endonuclease [Winogradskyella marina]